MTVKCLNQVQKDSVGFQHYQSHRSINELVDIYGVSRRTIIRVLEEQQWRFLPPDHSPPLTKQRRGKPTLWQTTKAFFGRLFY